MIRDEVVVVGTDRSYEPFSGTGALSERKGTHGHDRKKGSNNNSSRSSSNNNDNNNVFAGIIDFFAGLGKNKNKAAAAAAGADSDRADALSTTPLTAHDSEPGEDCSSELHDNDPGPLVDPRWSVYPPIAGGQQRRRTSQPVAIKRGPGTRARAPRPPEPAAGGGSGNADCPAGERRGEGGEGGGAREPVGDDAESKIKAWQQRRMSKKRESFTVRERDTYAAKHGGGKNENTNCTVSNRVMLPFAARFLL